jgi:hypothetical protein
LAGFAIRRIAILKPVFGSEGTTENSPAFQCRDRPEKHRVPEGRQEFLPPLRGLSLFPIHPAVETAGYFRLSLRDLNRFASLNF